MQVKPEGGLFREPCTPSAVGGKAYATVVGIGLRMGNDKTTKELQGLRAALNQNSAPIELLYRKFQSGPHLTVGLNDAIRRRIP